MVSVVLGHFEEAKVVDGDTYVTRQTLRFDPQQSQLELSFSLDIPFESDTKSNRHIFNRLYGNHWFGNAIAGTVIIGNLLNEGLAATNLSDELRLAAEKLINEIKDSLVCSTYQEYFGEFFLNSKDALIRHTRENGLYIKPLEIRITFSKQGNKYIASWSDNGGGMQKLNGLTAPIEHDQLYQNELAKGSFGHHEITTKKGDNHDEHGGHGIGMKQAYDYLKTDSDPNASMTWANKEDGINIVMISDKSRSAVNQLKRAQEEETAEQSKPVQKKGFTFIDSKLRAKLAKSKHHGHPNMHTKQHSVHRTESLDSGLGSSSGSSIDLSLKGEQDEAVHLQADSDAAKETSDLVPVKTKLNK